MFPKLKIAIHKTLHPPRSQRPKAGRLHHYAARYPDFSTRDRHRPCQCIHRIVSPEADRPFHQSLLPAMEHFSRIARRESTGRLGSNGSCDRRTDHRSDGPLRIGTHSRSRHPGETGFTRLPVLDSQHSRKLVGMISLHDLLRARTRSLEEERHRERVLRIRLPLGARGPAAVDRKT